MKTIYLYSIIAVASFLTTILFGGITVDGISNSIDMADSKVEAFYDKREQTLATDREVKAQEEQEVLKNLTKTSIELFCGPNDVFIGEGAVSTQPSTIFMRKQDDPMNMIMSTTTILMDNGDKLMVRVANIEQVTSNQRVRVYQWEKFKYAHALL